ncbi:Probable ATP-dependent RNA helicase Dbp73D [Gryllus bimaculatus]|nr:Probable ATP-dependent RNA helicase Dbp73D [Gryllus bimaculatus]
MDLFIMRRFGEESEKEPVNQEDHLSSLLEKIEERKKKREKLNELQKQREEAPSEEKRQVIKHVHVNEKEKKRKDKRKHKTENNEALLNDTSEKSESGIESPTKKKKKKRKNVELGNDGPLDELEIKKTEDACTKVQSKVPQSFTIIGTDKFSKKSKVKRVLPYWLAHPNVVSGSMTDISKTIYDIPSLDKDLVKRLEENNIKYFFPVQSKVIPWLLEAHRKPLQYRPNDVCISAPTGSGKTLAFVLPVIQALKSRVMRHVRALVVLPVRDLALQIFDVFKEYCKETDLKVILLTGHSSFVKEQQELVKTSSIIGQYNAVDIVVTTPGRLVEHLIDTPGFSLKFLQFLIIDEADRVVDNIQNDWLHHVEKHVSSDITGKQTALSSLSLQAMIPSPPQKLLFSATLTQDPEKLEKLGLFQPKLFTTIVGERDADVQESTTEVRGDFVGKYTTPAELTEKCCVVDPELKPLVLYHLISNENWKNVLCFTNSQKNTHRLALLLRYLGGGSLNVGEISGALRRDLRDKTIQRFSSGKLNVLVSSDALARGIDIPDVDYVVSYDVPKFVKTHIHRIGRTARAGRKGTAVTFLEKKEVNKFKVMLQTASKENGVEDFSVTHSDLEYLENDYKNALTALQQNLQKEEELETKKLRRLRTFRPKSLNIQNIQRKTKIGKTKSLKVKGKKEN